MCIHARGGACGDCDGAGVRGRQDFLSVRRHSQQPAAGGVLQPGGRVSEEHAAGLVGALGTPFSTFAPRLGCCPMVAFPQILYRSPSSNSMDALPSDRSRAFMTGRCRLQCACLSRFVVAFVDARGLISHHVFGSFLKFLTRFRQRGRQVPMRAQRPQRRLPAGATPNMITDFAYQTQQFLQILVQLCPICSSSRPARPSPSSSPQSSAGGAAAAEDRPSFGGSPPPPLLPQDAAPGGRPVVFEAELQQRQQEKLAKVTCCCRHAFTS